MAARVRLGRPTTPFARGQSVPTPALEISAALTNCRPPLSSGNHRRKIRAEPCRHAAGQRFFALTRLQLEATEIEEEFAMSKLASVAGVIAAAVLAAAIDPGAAAAFAATPHDQVTIRVSVADLSMTSEAGAQEALARIRHAAREVCGDSRVS